MRMLQQIFFVIVNTTLACYAVADFLILSGKLTIGHQ